MATEKQYDEIVAPMLLAVADRCRELGMDLVARVEWDTDQAGITQVGEHESAGQTLVHRTAHAHGNLDGLCIALIENVDVSQSAFLGRYQRKADE